LASQIIKKYGWDPNDCFFYEWYSKTKGISGDISSIEYDWDENNEASNPLWKIYCEREKNPFKQK
jgi:hypothetical protein